MFLMIFGDRTTSELLFYRPFLTLTSGARLEVRLLIVCSKCFPKQQRNFPIRQKIFVGVATVNQDVFVLIGLSEK